MDANLLSSGKTQFAAPTPADGDVAPLSMTSAGRVRTDVTGAVTVTGSVTDTPATGTGYTKVTTASTNAANIKNAAGTMYEISISNVTGATIYVKLYDKATSPTVGTDVPLVTLTVAAAAFLEVAFGPLGKKFTNGISIAVTAAAAATDTTNVTAGAQIHATYL